MLRSAGLSSVRSKAFSLEQHIGRLQIAVDHAVVVRVLDGFGHRADKLRGLARRQRTVGKLGSQACTLDVTHREIVLALVRVLKPDFQIQFHVGPREIPFLDRRVEPFRLPGTVEFALQSFHDLTEQCDRPLLIVDLFGR